MRVRCGNVQIDISFLFTVVLALILLFDNGSVLPAFLSVCAHESAHLLCMLLTGAQVKAVRLEAFGILIERGEEPVSFWKNLAILLAGCMINLLVAFGLLIWYFLSKNAMIMRICLMNFSLFFINILPVTGLDGGAVICAVISQLHSEEIGLFTVNITSYITIVILFIIGMILSFKVVYNLSLCAFSLYLLFFTLTKTHLNN